MKSTKVYGIAILTANSSKFKPEFKLVNRNDLGELA